MTTMERLQQRQQDLEAQYDLLSGKLNRLKEKRIIETDASMLFKLDTEIQAAEKDWEKLKADLAENEQAIKAAEMNKCPSRDGQGGGTFPSREGAGVGKREGKRPISYSPRPQVKHFFDRKQILDQPIAELRDAQKIMVMVDGIAGIGKTSLAVKVTEAVEPEFAGVYYKKCAPDTDADQLLAELAYFLGEYGDQTLAGVFEYAAQQEYKVKALIESLAKQRFLLLFDDVHELLHPQTQTITKPDLEAFFAGFLTQPHQSKILLVSRIRPVFHQAQMSQAKNPLGPIEQKEGIEFLRQMQVEEDADLLQQAYQFTGGHPLTMELLATLTDTMPLEDILANRQLFWSDTIVADKLLQKIYTTLTPEEQTLILKISILPRPVSNKVICALGESQNTMHILQSLVRKSLVTYDQKLKVYRLHDLVRDFHRLQLTEQQKKEYHLKAAAYYESLEFNRDKPTFEQVQNRLEARYHYFQAGEYDKAAQLLLDVVESYREWGYLQQCQIFLEETIKAIEQLPQTTGRQLLKVDLLIELSWVEISVESLDKAIQRCKHAENILKSFEDRRRSGNLYHALGRFLYEKGIWEEAKNYWEHSFKIRQQEKDTKKLVKVLKDLRGLYWNLGEINNIELVSKESLELCDIQGDVNSTAEILISVLGESLKAQRRFDEALTIYEESLSKIAHVPLIKALSLRLIGESLRQQKAYKEALKKCEESLKFAKEAGDFIAQAYALQGIGNIYRDEGQVDAAIEKYQEAVKIVIQSVDLSGKTGFLSNIGSSFRDAGQFNKTLEYYEQSLQLRKELNDVVGVAGVLYGIGDLYIRSADFDRALKYHKESLEIKQKLSRLISLEANMMRIGVIYREQGKLDKALEMFEPVLKLRSERQATGMASTLDSIGYTYYLKGDIQKALHFIEKSIHLCEERKNLGAKADNLQHLGEVYIAFGNYEKALAVSEEGLQLQFNPYYKAGLLKNIAEIYYRQERFTNALVKCEESLVFSHICCSKIQAGVTLHLMGKIRLQEQCYADALQHVQEAVTIFKDTGSRHLPEAEETLKKIQAQIEHG